MRGHSVNTRKDELDRGDNEICLKDEFREGDPKFIVLTEVSMGTGSSLGLDGEERVLSPEMGSGSDRLRDAAADKF